MRVLFHLKIDFKGTSLQSPIDCKVNPFQFPCIPLRALRESSSISFRFPSELKDPSMFLRFLYRFQKEALSIFIRFQAECSLYFLRFHKELPWISLGFPSISKGIPSKFISCTKGNLNEIEKDSLRALRGMQSKGN